VAAFSDSHEKLLRYDTLTSGDIEEMQANQAARPSGVYLSLFLRCCRF
jgi:hypothetical protein